MIKGYSLPLTPKGQSSIIPSPPWHYVGNVLAIEYEADIQNIAAFLPKGLELSSNKCAAYFIEWQYTSENREEYLDPVNSQYKETIILVSANYKGSPVAYCPFIWVDQDLSLMRGLVQGWPKQMGETHITRAYNLPSKAAGILGPGGKFGATLSVKGRRLVEARVTLEEQTEVLPNPTFAKAVNLRHFPELSKEKQAEPLFHHLVQLKSRDVLFTPIWKGKANLEFFTHPFIELPDLKPVNVNNGYFFSFALTVDDLLVLED